MVNVNLVAADVSPNFAYVRCCESTGLPTGVDSTTSFGLGLTLRAVRMPGLSTLESTYHHTVRPGCAWSQA